MKIAKPFLFAVFLMILAFMALASYKNTHSTDIHVNGGCADTSSPYLPIHYNDGRKISYCAEGDASSLEIISDWFSPQSFIVFEYAGYPNSIGNTFLIESDMGQLSPIDLKTAGEKWEKVQYTLPKNLAGASKLRIRAIDHSVAPTGWIGLGKARTTSMAFNISYLFNLMIVICLVHLGAIALYLIFSTRVRIDLAPLYFLVFTGISGWIGFWLFYIGQSTGLMFSIFALLVLMYLALKAPAHDLMARLKDANALILPVSTYAAFILIIGLFPFIQNDVDFVSAANRWIGLPIDNRLPRIFADQIWHGKVLSPMYGDWLSSDRPPLVTGIYLLFRFFENKDGMLYQVISSFLCATVFIPLTRILRSLKLRQLVPFALIALGASSLMAVHTLFVWPKLISATYVLVAYYIFLSPDRTSFSAHESIIVGGGSLALAILSHGGALFIVPVIYCTYLFQKRKPFFSKLFPLLFSLLIYLPWIAYQNYFDPPGNRLIKWHFAGMIEPNKLSVTQAFFKAYHEIDMTTWLNGRIANILYVFKIDSFISEISRLFLPEFSLNNFTKQIIDISFFQFYSSMWFMSPIIALLVWLGFKGWRKNYMNQALARLWYVPTLSILFWCLAMFQPGSVVIHQGAFAAWILSFLFSAVLIYKINRIAFYTLSILNVTLFLTAYAYRVANLDGLPAVQYMTLGSIALIFFVVACFLTDLESVTLECLPLQKEESQMGMAAGYGNPAVAKL